MTIRYDETATFFDGCLYVDIDYTDDQKAVSVTVGFDGLDSQTVTLERGQTHVFNFGLIFEFRIFKIESYTVNIQIGEKKVSNSISSVLANSDLFSVPDSDEKFSSSEINELKSKLESMESELHSMYEFTKEQAEFTRKAFDLINKNLENSSKTSWRQTTYSIITSVTCAVAPEHFEQVASLYGTAKEHIIPIFNALTNKSYKSFKRTKNSWLLLLRR
jgi:hypothetical protein